MAVLFTVVAVGLRLIFERFFGPKPQQFVVIFSGAALAAAWYGRFEAGLLSTVLGYLAAVYWFIEPRYSLRGERVDDLILLLPYAAASLMVSCRCERKPTRRPTSNRE